MRRWMIRRRERREALAAIEVTAQERLDAAKAEARRVRAHDAEIARLERESAILGTRNRIAWLAHHGFDV